jgi:hypothetical protein
MLLRLDGRAAPGAARDADGDRLRIVCPRCGWQPSREDRWMCGCLHVWNTFETGGVCPGCGRMWSDTQCLRCHAWSPHGDWYAPEDGALD